MNVASLELCKELRELSDWGGTDNLWRHHLPKPELSIVVNTEQQLADDYKFRNTSEAKRFREENHFYPAYDAGFMLRKLPQGTEVKKRINTKFEPDLEEDYSAMLPIDSGYLAIDYSPENALCKLAIELFKQGVLTQEGVNRE